MAAGPHAPARQPLGQLPGALDAAAALGLAVGDVVELTRGDAPVPVRIAGLFDAADLADERWFDQPVLRDGFTTSGSFTEVGPFVVDADDFTRLGGTANYRWRVIVDPDSVTTADLERLRSGAAGMATAIGDRVDVGNLEVTTQLPEFASVTDTAIGSTSAAAMAAFSASRSAPSASKTCCARMVSEPG